MNSIQQQAFLKVLGAVWPKGLPGSIAEVALQPSGALDCALANGCPSAKGFYANPSETAHPSEAVDLNGLWEDDEERALVVSLESAQAIEEPNHKRFVALLSMSCKVCLFSCQIPLQNPDADEEPPFYPPAYWAKLFQTFGMDCYDLRSAFWEEKDLDACFRQNFLVFVNPGFKADHLHCWRNPKPDHKIHPEILRRWADLRK